MTNAQRRAVQILNDRLYMNSTTLPDGSVSEPMIRSIEDESERRVVQREFQKLCQLVVRALSDF